MAPSRGPDFGERMFFVYDREAVQKESDPPEDAILYFYPTSTGVDDQVSICGQLIGMVHFTHSFLGTKPVLYKLKEEKVATRHSGRYSFALGGSLGEPDSFLIRQLETLFNVFSFYHGSVERVRKMSPDRAMFLSSMVIMWDCYLPFVRHYGDNLPQVFHPLPFLDLPKKASAGCFLKASHILQACQRRQHVLGGCILYKNSVLCTELEPTLTSRLLLLKPNQSHLPARPVKTEFDLPFGVRILNSFVTLAEYFNLYDTMAQSPYRQNYPGNSPGPCSTTGAAADNLATDENLGEYAQQSTCTCARLGELADYSSRSGSDSKTPVLEMETQLKGTRPLNTDIETRFDSPAINTQGTLSRTGGKTHEVKERQSSIRADNRLDSSALAKTELPSYTADTRRQSEGTQTDTCSIAQQTERSSTDTENVHSTNSLQKVPFPAFTSETEAFHNAPEFEQSLVTALPKPCQQETIEIERCSTSCYSQSAQEADNIEQNEVKGSVDKVSTKITKHYIMKHGNEENQHQDEEIPRVSKSSVSGSCESLNDKDTFDNRSFNDDHLALNNEPLIAMDEVDISDLRVVDNSGDGSRSRLCSSSGSNTGQWANERHETDVNEPYSICSEVLDTLVCEVVKMTNEGNSQQVLENDKAILLSICSSVVDNLIELACSSEPLCDEEAEGSKQEKLPNDEGCFKTECSKTVISTLGNRADDLESISDVFAEREQQQCNTLSELVDFSNLKSTPSYYVSRKGAINRSSESSVEGEEGRPCIGGYNRTSKEISSSESTNCDEEGEQKVFTEEHTDSGDTSVHERNEHTSSLGSRSCCCPNDSGMNLDQNEGKSSAVPPTLESDSPSVPGSVDSGGRTSSELEGDQEPMQYEQGVGYINQVEDMAHVNLYVQAHSDVVLILLAEDGLQQEKNTIKALWETSLSELGELEFQVKEALAAKTKHTQKHDYSFLVYNSVESTMKGNLPEPVLQVDNMFCDTAKQMHEQFNSSDSLKDVTLRSLTSAVYGKRTLGQETYFQQKGSFRAVQGVPASKDPAFIPEKRVGKLLYKEHGVNVF